MLLCLKAEELFYGFFFRKTVFTKYCLQVLLLLSRICFLFAVFLRMSNWVWCKTIVSNIIMQLQVDRFIKQSLCEKRYLAANIKTLATSQGVCLSNELNHKNCKLWTDKCSVLWCQYCDVIWFVICVTWFEKSGTASGSSHLSGHPKDPEK